MNLLLVLSYASKQHIFTSTLATGAECSKSSGRANAEVGDTNCEARTIGLALRSKELDIRRTKLERIVG